MAQQQQQQQQQQYINQFSSDGIPWAQGFEHNYHELSSNFVHFTDLHHQRPWHVDDSSLRSLIQTDGSSSSAAQSKERLALSLFNMKQYQQQNLLMQDTRANSFHSLQQQQPFQPKNSKYLSAAQELLNEFCSLYEPNNSKKIRVNKTKSEEFDRQLSLSSSSLKFQSMDLLELQKIKAKLLSMLEEVDRQYKRYCEQMRNVVSSFEAVAGQGAANVYSGLASKAMSRHFRCIRDGIVLQIRAIRKQMGESEESNAIGSTKGETPRLKLLDQCMRQQKAFQQGMMEQHPWRPQRGLPERSVSILRSWLFEHFLHPYPNDVDKHILSKETGLSRSQVSNWFINARVRLWKPMVEEMYIEETKDVEDQLSQHEEMKINSNPNISTSHEVDEKPNLVVQQLNDSNNNHSLSSIINRGNNASLNQNHSYGMSNYDFLYNNNNGNVSLTLGLQQHGDNNNNSMKMLSFSSNSNQSLVFTNDDVDGGQQVQFSIGDGESHNLNYRKFMGSQLLHDLAG